MIDIGISPLIISLGQIDLRSLEVDICFDELENRILSRAIFEHQLLATSRLAQVGLGRRRLAGPRRGRGRGERLAARRRSSRGRMSWNYCSCDLQPREVVHRMELAKTEVLRRGPAPL